MRTIRSLLILSFLVTAPVVASADDPVMGRWVTEDGKAVVNISLCGQTLCGHIAKVLDTAPGVPTTDVKNPDANLRSRPITGLTILSGFTGGNGTWEGGTAYDPKSGNHYHAQLHVNGDGSLKVTGCVLFVCQSKRWTRAA
jgi:uncharacterized protein (DUF2147 family)